MPEETIETIKKYMHKYIKKGHELNELVGAFKQKGYPKEDIKKALDEVKAELGYTSPIARVREIIQPKVLVGVLAVLLVVSAAWFVITSTTGAKDCGYDKTCFIKLANRCEPAMMTGDFVGSTIKYYTTDCILKKEVVKLSEDEPQEVQALFKGKEMRCPFSEGKFNRDYVDGLLGGIGGCEGTLKDIIYELRIAQYTALY